MFGFRNKRGAVVVDGKLVGETLQCVHCSYTWQVIPGSGIKRGWCPDCAGPLCGRHECMTFCTPFEARLDLTEALAGGADVDVAKILKKYEGIKPF